MNWKDTVEDWVEKNKQHMISLLTEMVSFKSVNPKFIENPSLSEVNKLQSFLQDYISKLGMVTDKWDVYHEQPNVVGKFQGKSKGNTLILNGHIDVVPEGDLSKWKMDPWRGEIHEGKFYGRGSGDMKAGVLSNIMVAKFISDLNIDLQSDLQLHIVTDEEGGGGGTRSALERGYVGDAVIVTEPTNCEINPVEGGLQWVRITVKGASAHGGWRYRHIYPGFERTGVNVIEKSLKILQSVLDLEREWGLYKSHPLLPAGITTINPGVMLAGSGTAGGYPLNTENPAIIPDHCVMEFDLKYLPSEDPEQIKKDFEEYIQTVALTDKWLRENPPAIEWGVHGVDFPPVETPLDHPLVTSLADSRNLFDLPNKYDGFIAVSDAAFYAGKGIPALIYGPRGDQYHGENEYVELNSMFEVTKTLIVSMLHWNGIISK